MQFYASRAVYNGASQAVSFQAMLERLRSRGFSSLQLRSEELETDHGGAIYPSFEHGLAGILGVAP